MAFYTHVKIYQLVNKMCSQQGCSRQVVKMLLVCQIVTRLSVAAPGLGIWGGI